MNGWDPTGESMALALGISGGFSFSIQAADVDRVIFGAAVALAGISIIILMAELAPVIGTIGGQLGQSIDDYITEIMTNLRAVTREAAKALRRNFRLKLIPILPVFEVLWPDIYAFNSAYILTNPSRQILNYLGPQSIPTNFAAAQANRNYVQATFNPTGGPPPPKPDGTVTELDEYPFASTFQGGALGPAWGVYVDAAENASQGGVLSVFYRFVLKSVPSAAFGVVPVPK